jgi:hypothetical protein
MSALRRTTLFSWLLAAACVSTTPRPTTPDDAGPRELPPEGAPDDRSMGALRKRLEAFRTKKETLVSASTQDPAVCESLCSLATDICDVAQKLCELADQHPDDDQYQNLCREGRKECHEAQQSCVRCVESNK